MGSQVSRSTVGKSRSWTDAEPSLWGKRLREAMWTPGKWPPWSKRVFIRRLQRNSEKWREVIVKDRNQTISMELQERNSWAVPLGCHHQDGLVAVTVLFLGRSSHVEIRADVLVQTVLGRRGRPSEYHDIKDSEAPGLLPRTQATSLAGRFISSPCKGWQRDRTKPGLAEGAQQGPAHSSFRLSDTQGSWCQYSQGSLRCSECWKKTEGKENSPASCLFNKQDWLLRAWRLTCGHRRHPWKCNSHKI